MQELSKKYRHADNPEEARFHEAATELGSRMLSSITLPLNVDGTGPSRYLTDPEEQIAINMLQWLGSPVGQCWLRDLGYTKNK